MKMSKIRLIGDIHGDGDAYKEIIKDCEYSIQVGDMGYKYDWLRLTVDHLRHKFIPGNHESYDEVFELDHVVKTANNNQNFGMSNLAGFDFFFVRGGFSLDWQIRDLRYKMGMWPQTYFPEEELSELECHKCLEEYKKVKPRILISHECPRSISRMVGSDTLLIDYGHDPNTFTTRTSELLEAMIKEHQPEKMFFGHYHFNWSKKIDDTLFTCIGEHEFMDIEING